MATTTVRKDIDKNATLDFTFQWEAFLDPDSDAIASTTVTCPVSGLTISNITATTSTVRAFIKPGTEGTTYPVINHIWTTGGRQEDKVLQLTIIDEPSTSHAISVETGTGSATANSYASVANGDTYHASHLYASTWTQATDANKEKALIWATRLLDEHFMWDGRKASETQALQWPRFSTTDRDGFVIDSDAIPQALKDATAELARHLIAADRTAEDDTRGFSRIKVGSIDLNIDVADRTNVIPAAVSTIIPRGMGRLAGIGVSLLERS